MNMDRLEFNTMDYPTLAINIRMTLIKLEMLGNNYIHYGEILVPTDDKNVDTKGKCIYICTKEGGFVSLVINLTDPAS